MDPKSISSSAFDFSGSIPQRYDQFLGPLFFEPYAIEVVNRVNPSTIRNALEIASGTGRVTRHLRNILTETARLVASDISPDMLAVARKKLTSPGIDWQIIDAQKLPFDDGSFDLVVCCFGYMFITDRLIAFSEAYRVLRPGGMLIFTTWDKLELNAASFVYRTIAKQYLEETVFEACNLPFSMYDETIINSLLQEAGFVKIIIEKVKKISISQTAKEATEGLTNGGIVYNEIMKRNPGWMEEIKNKTEKQLTENFGFAPMTAPMTAVISRAWK